MKKTHYYLFGSQAVSILMDSDEPNALEQIADAEHALFSYNEDFQHPTELLLAYDGWGAFTEISEATYREITALNDIEGKSDELVSALIKGETVVVRDRFLPAVTKKLREIKKNCTITLSQIKNP
jgi:hypothetical protein